MTDLEKGIDRWCPKHITTGTVAEYCGVSKVTVLRWIKKGHLNAFRLPEGHCRIHRDDFFAFLVKNSIPIRNKMVNDNKNNNKTKEMQP